MKKGCIEMHDALIQPKPYPSQDDIYWFLDHWVIVREDGTPILNGTPEEFEKQLRELIFDRL
jgi:hypothetical protein